MGYPARRSDARNHRYWRFIWTRSKRPLAKARWLELKLRLLAGKVPTLRKYAHQQNLGNIENELATHFGDALSVAEKDMLRLCRQLRNKVLHSNFYAARGKLGELGIDTQSGGVKMIPLPVATVEELRRRSPGREPGRKARMSPTRCPRMRAACTDGFSKRAPPAISTRRATHSKGQGDN